MAATAGEVSSGLKEKGITSTRRKPSAVVGSSSDLKCEWITTYTHIPSPLMQAEYFKQNLSIHWVCAFGPLWE
jgi:hypothetical protein